MKFGTASALLPTVSFLLLIISAAGCTEFKVADNDPDYASLIGHRCVVTTPAMFPEGGPHWLPSMHSGPTPYPLVLLQPGTVLQVNHVETWTGPLWPLWSGGESVFAEIENGRRKGTNVALGIPEQVAFSPGRYSVVFTNADLGFPEATGDALQPYGPSEKGVFYTANAAEKINRRASNEAWDSFNEAWVSFCWHFWLPALVPWAAMAAMVAMGIASIAIIGVAIMSWRDKGPPIIDKRDSNEFPRLQIDVA